MAETITPEQELQHAISEAVRIAERAQHDPERHSGRTVVPSGQPTLARLRHADVDRVKTMFWQITNRDVIRYQDSDSQFARVLLDKFEQAVARLESAQDHYKGEQLLRVYAVIDELNDSCERIRAAQKAIAEERERKDAEREARLPSDSQRYHKLLRRARLIGDIYDLADHLAIEHKGRADISNSDAADLIDAISAKLDGQDFTEAAEALRQGKYTQAEAPSDYVAEVKYGNKYGL
jgi:hypothetical protein